MEQGKHSFKINPVKRLYVHLTHQIRTSEDNAYTTGDLVFCKRENSYQWHDQEQS